MRKKEISLFLAVTLFSKYALDTLDIGWHTFKDNKHANFGTLFCKCVHLSRKKRMKMLL